MATPQTGVRRRGTDNNTELWFDMPSSRRPQEPSAYGATSTRHHATRSASANQLPSIPLISTTPELNKPLPPSPKSQRRKGKPSLLDSMIKRRPSENLDPSHLLPESYSSHSRSSSNGNLSPGLYPTHYQSRSMPSSPLDYSPPHPPDMQRARSAAGSHQDNPQYRAYSPQAQPQSRTVSMETFEASPPRARRTFPDSNPISSPTLRENVSDRPRPHTWLSPTEPFGDASDFHLFAQATSGLPDGFDPLSPHSTPPLQSSLFAARGNQNDRIPVLARNSSTPSVPVMEIPQYDWMPQHAPREFTVSSSALPRRDSYDMNTPPSPRRTANMNTINLELERLGLAEQEQPDDELPDYAQSQAEMAAIKRKEAASRARELEARWNSSRGWRSR